jgi:hypothetical protein
VQWTKVYLEGRFVWLCVGDIHTRKWMYLPQTACSNGDIIPLGSVCGKFYHFIIITMTNKIGWSRDSSDNIATGWAVGSRFPPGARNISLHSVQTGCGAHPVSLRLPGALSLCVMGLRHKGDHSPPSGDEAKFG